MQGLFEYFPLLWGLWVLDWPLHRQQQQQKLYCSLPGLTTEVFCWIHHFAVIGSGTHRSLHQKIHFYLEESCPSPLPWLSCPRITALMLLGVSLFLLMSEGKVSALLSITTLYFKWIAASISALQNETDSKPKWNIFDWCNKPRKQERESLHRCVHWCPSLLGQSQSAK